MARLTVAATDIVGTHVENWEAENLGTITDIMINKHDGEVEYLVLSYPGDYGRQYPNKRFAVPFTAVARKIGTTGVEYIMDIDQQFLEKAQGFDTDHWPDFADERFTRQLKDFYKDVSVDIRV